MENTITQQMLMRVRLSDVSDRSSAIEYVGQGTWFDGKSFVCARYKSTSNFYFFVYDDFVPAFNYFDEMDSNIGNEIWNLNPNSGKYQGKIYIYDTMLNKLIQPYSISQESNSPVFIFEIR
jgi:hypothetical protein